ncbi:hypothetical protein [Candidatus Nitrosotalea sp. TS]|uniref:hypothetical protein n=1 Tax=Candidatus Nitrosotalea sp. TS TaxID=2341020 RepID=UPI00140DCA2B|nr:hypothetical protein [Candidatus Nitrosotalea sp. TS]
MARTVYAADMSGAITAEDFAHQALVLPLHTECLKACTTREIKNEQAKEIATRAVAAAMERDPRLLATE